MGTSFDPSTWLETLTQIGGGYALMSGDRLFLTVEKCIGTDLTALMAAIVGQPERLESIKRTIELRQIGEVA